MKLKYIFGFAVVTLTLMFAAACGESGPKADGASVFKTHCQLCHGPDGRLGLNGAKDFTTSPLTEDERVQVITKGRNTMLSYENILSADEIAAVAKYTMKLSKGK